jgi:DNA-binding NarL/FixJ family response regulator
MTSRQVEVLSLVAKGLTDAQIAKKLGVPSRTRAMRYAIDHKIV